MSIKELRLEKGWSQEHLAELTNLSSRTIQRIEKDNKASLESLKALANAFEMEVSQLQNIIQDSTKTQTIQEQNIQDKPNSFFDYLKQDKGVHKYLLVNIMLVMINLIFTPNTIWFIYPLLGWGIPLFYKQFKRFYQ